MSRAYVLIILGVLIALAPFVGIPLSWLMWGFPIIGFVTAFIGFSMRRPAAPKDSSLELVASEISSAS